ncbi:MAG: UPF0489 family protein [Planctomycetota bacterium]
MRIPNSYHLGWNKHFGSGRSLMPGHGNNGFSINGKPFRDPIEVAPLKLGSLEELVPSKDIAIQDFKGGEWRKFTGLSCGLLTFEAKIPVYIFDNHNHAFYAWCESVQAGWLEKGATLVHIDSHEDSLEPDSFQVDVEDLSDVYRYTNEILNVANFISPAFKVGFFEKLINFTHVSKFSEPDALQMSSQGTGDFALDIDIDVCSKDHLGISVDRVLAVIAKYLPLTRVITIATSPYFVDQDEAVCIVKQIVNAIGRMNQTRPKVEAVKAPSH